MTGVLSDFEASKTLIEQVNKISLKVKDFPARNVEPFSKRKGVTGKVGHYTQIVWAETYKIGCGYIMYKKGKRFNKVRYYMIIIPILMQIKKLTRFMMN